MIICSGNKIEKNFAGSQLFTDVNFQINEGERVGLVGSNGCGKTTILNMIASIETIDSGTIAIKKGTNVGYVKQIPEFAESLTVIDVLKTAFSEVLRIETECKKMEQILASTDGTNDIENLLHKYGELQIKFEQHGGYEVESKIASVVNGLGISKLIGQSFSKLSGGEKTKVSLAIVLLQETDLLLLDEPTNHLDIHAIQWLTKYMTDYKGTVIVVSHDRYFLDECVTKIIEIEDGEAIQYHGNYSFYIEEKQNRLLQEFQRYEEQQKKIKKMKEAIKRLREWANQANPPNEGLHKRARNMERALERMEKLKKPVLEKKKIGLEFQQNDRSGKDVINLNDVSLQFGNVTILNELSIFIRYGERVVLMGGNGAGKTSLLKICLGEISPTTGTVKVGSNVKIGYLSQHFHISNKNITVIEAFRDLVAVTEQEARSILAKFLFYGGAVFRKIDQLSGGEKMRLRLAQLMYQDINLLILDEPTNHLDIDSKEVLEEAIDEFNGTILAVSHDRYFINRLFSKIIWIENGETTEVLGDYEKVKERFLSEETQKYNLLKITKPIEKSKPKVSGKKNDVTLGEMEATIQSLEDEIRELNVILDNEVQLETIQTVYNKISEKQKDLENAYLMWENFI